MDHHDLSRDRMHKVGPHAFMCDHGLVMQFLPITWPPHPPSGGDALSGIGYIQRRYKDRAEALAEIAAEGIDQARGPDGRHPMNRWGTEARAAVDALIAHGAIAGLAHDRKSTT